MTENSNAGSIQDFSATEIEGMLTNLPVTYQTRDYIGPPFRYSEPYEKTEVLEDWREWEELQGEAVVVDGLGIVTVVETFGGEGMGDQYYMVFKLEDCSGERFFKLDGWYASWDGGTYDRMFEVKPVEKTVTFYESV